MTTIAATGTALLATLVAAGGQSAALERATWAPTPAYRRRRSPTAAARQRFRADCGGSAGCR